MAPPALVVGKSGGPGDRSAALLRSPYLLLGGWRPRLLLLSDFNLVSGHVRAPPRPYGAAGEVIRSAGSQPRADREPRLGRVAGASPIWFGLTGFSRLARRFIKAARRTGAARVARKELLR